MHVSHAHTSSFAGVHELMVPRAVIGDDCPAPALPCRSGDAKVYHNREKQGDRRGAVVPKLLVMVCVSCTLLLTPAHATTAHVSCTDWNTKEFFENATAIHVSRCLSVGANLEARTERGLTPLHMAAKYSTAPSVIAVLLDAGANLEARTVGGSTPLHLATRFPSAVTTLVEAGADLEARSEGGFTPLHNAARFGATFSVVTAFLDAGADLEARTDAGLTPLHLATRFPSAVTTLLDAGADLKARDIDGWTPLHQAVKDGETSSVRALLDAGADLEAGDNDGWTPLHMAAKYSIASPGIPMLIVLLDAGADPSAKAEDGRVPWDLVKDTTTLKGTETYWRLSDGRFE